ncbi:MAG: VRR-NUC domain-containing protein [Treponema sp.]|nr:VRR-NUC domain-containing protein [Treponema sp.]
MKVVDEYLTLKRIPHYRINSGGLKDSHGRLVRFGAKGMADFYAIGPAGISVWIECKRPKGGRLSAAQKEFLDCVNRHSGVGIVVNSVESLESQLQEAGII